MIKIFFPVASTLTQVNVVRLCQQAVCASALLLVGSVWAQTTVGAQDRTEVPDGSPTLPAAQPISSKAELASDKLPSVILGEERVQGRISSARVNAGGSRSYLVVDPNVGRAERLSDNDGRRHVPSLWEVLKF